MVVLALNNILRAAVVEPEDFVVEVQAVGIHLETPWQSVAGLCIELVMRIQIVVAKGTLYATWQR